jgi:hypothetical protein
MAGSTKSAFKPLPCSCWAIDGESTNFAVSRKMPAFSIAPVSGGAADGIVGRANIFIDTNQHLK